MNSLPRREQGRPKFRSGIKSAAEIMADVEASGIQDDNDKTGAMGIRDSAALRKNAENLRKGK
jgi:hypothetical protein